MGAERKRAMLRVIAHELTHSMLGGGEETEPDAQRLDDCTTRDLTAEDAFDSAYHANPKAHEANTNPRCRVESKFTCRRITLMERPPDWFNLETQQEEDDDKDPDEPWCGAIRVRYGNITVPGSYTYWMCVGVPLTFCWNDARLICDSAFAPGRPGALAAATRGGDPARPLLAQPLRLPDGMS